MINRWLGNLRFFVRLAAFVVVTVALWIVMELEMLVRWSAPRLGIINKWVPRWAKTLIWIFGVRVAARGPYVGQGKVYPGCCANGVGRIFVMNHRSGGDIPIILTLAAAHAISRHDLADWPLIGPGARRIGTLFVDRRSRRSGAEVLKKIARSLEAGEGIAMFPEGTAFPGDEVRLFRPGAFKAAQRSGAEIVPLGIAYENPAAYFTGKSFLSHMKRIASFPSLRVAVEVGEPISPEGLSAVEMKELAQQRVVQLVTTARRRLDGPPHISPPSTTGRVIPENPVSHAL